MAISIPHKRIIDCLIAHKETVKSANKFLTDRAFPEIPSPIYADLYKELHNAFPGIDEDALDDMGIRDMYAYLYDDRYFRADAYPKDCFEKAFKAWEIPQVRRSLQAMAFAQISEEEIELYSNGKYGAGYETEVYIIFFKYFFDTFDWTYGQRHEYMTNEPSRDLKRLYVIGLTKDADFIVWKLGLAPTRSFTDMLEDVTRDCYYNFKEQKDISSENAQKWGNLMLKAMDKIRDEEPEGKGSKFYEEFQITLRTPMLAEEIKTLDEL